MIIDLNELVRSLTAGAGSYAFCGIGLSTKGRTTFHTSTARGITPDENSMFRVASVSKIVAAAAFEGAAFVAGLERPSSV